ncbi:MFS transporter [Spongiactinospora rosea]|uniref:MFS transporter n=1 Tax=Spongiactinospora rosea TaxID=2248750 RepID=A0A366LT12_9ACTN|nr:MFS transporter [Spongiactinospora rosea]RBQ17058.1 MFS transporter [Spongiactinospora rosea]
MTSSLSRSAVPRTGRLPLLLGAMLAFNTVGYIAITASVSILLPGQVAAADPAGKLGAFGLVTGISAIASVCVPPIVGAWSDRTKGRWGRRSPWFLAGGITAAASLVLLGSVSTVTGLLIGWFLVQGTVNIGLNIVLAVVADRVPARRLGLASTLNGLGIPIGGAVGVWIGAALSGSVFLAYCLLAAVFLAGSLAMALVAKESAPSTDPAPARGGSIRAEIAGAVASLRTRDYAWAFAARAVMFLGYFTVSSFSLYALTDYIRLPAGLEPAAATATSTSVTTGCLVLGMLIMGPLADRLDRRKLFVLLSSLLITVATVLPLLSPTWDAQLASAVLSGIGFGTYLSVDQALVTLVLPAADGAGRDLGVFHIALNAPQVVAPFAAAFVVGGLGGYPALYAAGGLLALAGSLLILPIRSVR